MPSVARLPVPPPGATTCRGTRTTRRRPRLHHLSPRPRLSWLRVLPVLARPITELMPWGTLITGCLAGIVYLAVQAHFADIAHSPLDYGSVRLAFLPAAAALAFVPAPRSGH